MKEVPYARMNQLIYFLENRKNPTNLRSYLFEQYGDIYQYTLGGYTTVYICHPEYVRHVLDVNGDNYFPRHKYVVDSFSSIVGTEGLFTSNHKMNWQHDRNVIEAVFDPDIFFEAYSHTIIQKTEEIINTWKSRYKNGDIIDLDVELDRLILLLVANTLFCNLDVDPCDIADSINLMIKLYIDKFYSLNRLAWIFPTQRKKLFIKMSNYLLTLASKIVSDRLTSKKQYDDLLGMLLRANEHLPSDVRYQRVRAHVATFASVGYLTTSALLQYALVMISQNPHHEEKILNECNTVTQGRQLCYAHVDHLAYLRLFLKEVIRYWPILSSESREAIADDHIGEYVVKKGSGIILSTYHVHHHPHFWVNPEGFFPERFLDNPYGQSEQFAYIPFGHGLRNCVGRRFALLESMLILPLLLRHFHFCLPSYSSMNLYPKASTMVTSRPSVSKFNIYLK